MVCPAIPAQITSHDEPEIAPFKLRYRCRCEVRCRQEQGAAPLPLHPLGGGDGTG